VYRQSFFAPIPAAFLLSKCIARIGTESFPKMPNIIIDLLRYDVVPPHYKIHGVFGMVGKRRMRGDE